MIAKGLDGIVVDDTAISLVDGESGRLYYRGYPIEELITHPFAAVAHLVVFGALPDAPRLAEFEQFLWQAGHLPPEVAAQIDLLGRTGAHPMSVLQAAMPLMAMHPPAPVALAEDLPVNQALTIAARLPAALARLLSQVNGRAPYPYPASTRYGVRFLQSLHGQAPDAGTVSAFEQTQILQIEHSFNASTFTARVVTSTLSPAPSALAAAMGSLYGPLHGGADQAALEMADEVGDPGEADAYVSRCLAERRVVMGMGHREYRVVDPRARIVRALAEGLALTHGQRARLTTLKAIEQAFVTRTAQRTRTLRANLEFYKGVVYEALGIPKEFFTATFAAARIFGWAAHIIEQRRDNRIMRPRAHYTGPPPREPSAA